MPRRGTESGRVAMLAIAIAAVVAGPSVAGVQHHGRTGGAAPSPEDRASRVLKTLTLDEKLLLVRGYFGASLKGAPPPLNAPPPEAAHGGAGYVPGVPRLGIPALQESDAGLGVANGGHLRPGEEATPLPSGLAQAASWNPQVAYDGGAMIGAEAAAKGFNVLLAGGADLARDPRNGRNFEYAGEDPLLAGVMVGQAIKGIQSRHVISTIKHFAANDQETGRMVLSADLDEKSLRETDLLAFEIAIETGRPGSVMCAYNRINGDYACENDLLLNKVLKGDWGYRGWVMSDWGGVHSTVKAAVSGLDQESAHGFDREDYFGAALKAAVLDGRVPPARLDDMARRVLRSMFAVEVSEAKSGGAIDRSAHADVAQRAAEEGAVLLRNQDGLLPLAPTLKRIAVIGGHADVGVLSGGGSSQVIPFGGAALEVPVKTGRAVALGARIVYHPSSPLAAIRSLAPGATVTFTPGDDVAAAVAAARGAEIVIVFAEQWQTEFQDVASLSLPDHQDALIAAVAAANPQTVVVLETGNPVTMPWLDKTPAVLEAWYPGARGGQAIANLLFGKVSPSGKLPISFPADASQLPRPVVPGADHAYSLFGAGDPPFSVPYVEGSAVGYKWFAAQGSKPLFPFGHGLSYSRFAYGRLTARGGRTVSATFTVRNVGARAAAEVAQVYATPPRGGVRRLIGWRKVMLKPGETRRLEVTADARLLADYDTAAPGWRTQAGAYRIEVGASSADTRLRGAAKVESRVLKP